MEKSLKNAKELHYEHQTWLSDLAEMRIELTALEKYKPNVYKKDIGKLLKRMNSLERMIKKHEKTIALAFKTCDIDQHTEIFADHGSTRKSIDTLRFKLDNLNHLFTKKPMSSENTSSI